MDEATKPKNGRLSVAFYNKDTNTYQIKGFRDSLVDKNCGGKESLI